MCKTLEIKAFDRFDNLAGAFFIYVLGSRMVIKIRSEPLAVDLNPLQGKIKKYGSPKRKIKCQMRMRNKTKYGDRTKKRCGYFPVLISLLVHDKIYLSL